MYTMKARILTMLALCGFMPAVFADETATAATHGGGWSSLVMFGALFAMMYFMMIRPQSKKAKEHRNMLASITKGDEVITQGGMLGKIARDAGNFFILSLSEGVEVPVQKQSIVQVLPKGTLNSI